MEMNNVTVNVAAPVKDLKIIAKLIENNQQAVEKLIQGLSNRKVIGILVEAGVD